MKRNIIVLLSLINIISKMNAESARGNDMWGRGGDWGVVAQQNNRTVLVWIVCTGVSQWQRASLCKDKIHFSGNVVYFISLSLHFSFFVPLVYVGPLPRPFRFPFPLVYPSYRCSLHPAFHLPYPDIPCKKYICGTEWCGDVVWGQEKASIAFVFILRYL